MMRKALIVGIDDYGDASLSGCVNDATTMSTILERNADGSPNFAIMSITSPPLGVTRQNLRQSLNQLFLGDCDVALFYFAGHGLINESGGFIVTSDYDAYDEGISMDEILKLANKSKAKDKIIILDCCHSGTLGNISTDGSNSTQLNDGVTILTACRPYESAMENNGQGLFTSLLIDALYGGAADIRGYITPGGLYAYVDAALGPWDQRPMFKTNVSRFTRIRTVPPQIPFDVLRKLTDYFTDAQSEHDLDPTYEDTTPDANPENVQKFKHLQKYVAEGLVKPVGEDHMYYAAMNSKSCKLTALGYHFWRLVKEGKI
ncbi:caspase family protein [Paenibacillus sp. LS1]|uniref:caspase family protein n=1 Tax=Paenibacillus sp. LS1 TaxID=2992120 RepID=UPI00222FD54F|nr:caspase family protein [Paenibacillus sp. LS1]